MTKNCDPTALGKQPKPDGGPAFPIQGPSPGFGFPGDIRAVGMSLRDYFAIRAPEPTEDSIAFECELDRFANPHNDTYKPPRRSLLAIVAELKYRYADAMLAERAKP